MPTPLFLVHHHGGIARGSQLGPFGCTRRDLAAAVRRQELIRIRPGVFAAPSCPVLVRTAALHGGALTCAGALRLHSVWVLSDDSSPHVWLGQAGRAHAHAGCGCVGHYRNGTMTLGLAPVEDALAHSYACLGEEFFFAAYESAWAQRLIGAAARRRIRDALPPRARWLVDLARHDAGSGIESIMRLRLHLLGVIVETQVEISGVGRVDFVIEGRLIIEADGRGNHDGSTERHRDLMRDAAASRLGYETLRFDYAMIIHDWDAVVAAIFAALGRVRS
ncbi:type IV toxin-antitoxin system AbiEi family antitoxin domain-containing protein [Microbacterium sp. 3J1]|uniref:type IV toxin-antitoxin system AbiEi family antitoxin domain-containing protein n=1 Tax=Microbacterium sp. 3J1 TaxID=861269 RepID=UPI000B19D6D8|nr:type IV toxin-antitoxin system AbiEi family antitoxin domain-containing protein [Microbacterium sp. 3J1]